MKLITKRYLIRTVAVRWRQQYEPFKNDNLPLFSERMGIKKYRTKKQIAELLDALDKEVATENDVEQIIGSFSWTHLECDDCKEPARAVMQFGEEPDYESRTANICEKCFNKSISLWNQEGVGK